MNEDLDDRQIARLLSGKDQPSVLEKEAQFERIWRSAAPRNRFWFARWGALALASSTATLVLVGIGLVSWPDSEFTARGGQASSSSLTLTCVDRSGPAPCRPDSKLSFQLDPADDAAYFAAFARRSDQTVIWYYPDKTSRSLPIAGRTERQLLKEGIRLGPEHPPGRYAIYGVFSKKPLTREQIKTALGDALVGDETVQVIRRDLVIENRR